MKLYEIYMHTAPNGKAYIGQTCNRARRDSQHRRLKKRTPLTDAITEFGWDAFEHETLASGLTKDEANEAEIRFIAEFDTIYPNGLNLHQGGGFDILTSEVNEAYKRDVPFNQRNIKPKKLTKEEEQQQLREKLNAERREQRRKNIEEEIKAELKEKKKEGRRGGVRYGIYV